MSNRLAEKVKKDIPELLAANNDDYVIRNIKRKLIIALEDNVAELVGLIPIDENLWNYKVNRLILDTKKELYGELQAVKTMYKPINVATPIEFQTLSTNSGAFITGVTNYGAIPYLGSGNYSGFYPSSYVRTVNYPASYPITNTPMYYDTNPGIVPTVYSYNPEPIKDLPNKMAQADTWNNKVVWNSSALMDRQLKLETYSAEVAMVIEAICNIASRAMNRKIEKGELYFVANFGSPVVGNKQSISVSLERPVVLKVILIRELVDCKLKWSADIGIADSTPVENVRRIVEGGGEFIMDSPLYPCAVTPLEESKRRKVRI